MPYEDGTSLAFAAVVDESFESWEGERQSLMARKISELGLGIAGTRVEKMILQLYSELERKGLAFRPPAYLTDQWGCPDGTPLIGVPFYLADPRLERIEDDFAEGIESEQESMRFMRHEAGHAFNYAYRVYDRADWRKTFGSYSRPYRERYKADPFSHDSDVKALPIMEMDFTGYPGGRPKIASWEAKWGDDGDEKGAEFEGTKSIFPENVSEGLAARMKQVAIDAFQALRLRDYARVDLRVNDKDEIYVIEVNPNCYLEQGAEFAAAAAKDGMEYPALINRIVELASARYSR